MLSANPRKFTLTFICYVALALFLTDIAQAKGYAHVPLRRDHADLNRMVRKRGPVARGLGDLLNGGAVNAAGNPPSTPSNVDPVTSPSTQPSTSTPPATTSTSLTSTSTTSSDPLNLGPLFSFSTSSSTVSSSSVSSSSTSSSSSSSSSSPPPPPSSSTSSSSSSSSSPPSVPTPVPVATSVNPATEYQTVTNTSVPAASDSASPSAASSSSSSSTNHTTITVVIVVASCIAGIAIIWTIIRKWKFRPSAQFEDRMQPIDWQPAGPDDAPALHRTASTVSHGSFHSGGPQPEERLNPIPDHDFTAGPAHLAPVGGYADLARGPSPQPQQMQEALTRGPSMIRPAYDPYAVPLHHQGAYDTYSGGAGARY